MFEIDKVEFQNAGRFVDVQTIPFDVPGLTALDGDNLNTGGSSGAGKSTVFSVFDYAFGCSTKSAVDLQSRLTKDALWVRVYGRNDGKNVIIHRSKKTGLDITIGEEVISGNNALAEAKLDEIIKIPRALFKKIIHKRQGEGGHFLSLTNSKASEFLIECLGLKSIDEKATVHIKKASDIQDDIDNLEYDLDKYGELIKENEGSKSLLSNPGEKPDDSKLAPLETSIISLDQILLDLSKQNEIDIKDLSQDKPQPTELGEVLSDETSYKQYSDLEKKINEHKFEIKTILDKILEEQTSVRQETRKMEKMVYGFEAIKSSVEVDQKTAIALKKEIDHFVVDKCPTCSQVWDAQNILKEQQEELLRLVKSVKDGQDYLKEEAPLLEKLKALEITYEGLEKKPEEVISLEKSLEEFQQQYSEIKSEQKNREEIKASEYKAELATFENKTQELTHSYQNKVQQTNVELIKLTSDKQQLESVLNSYDALLTQYTKQLDHYESNIKDHKAKLKTAKKDLSSKIKQKDIELESARAAKLYLLEVFEDTLIEIGERATELVNRIPNMSAATIEYRGEKENKSGTIKKEICPYLTLDGITIPLKTLSGGERCSIDLVVDFAVEEIIETRAGVGASWKVLDEPFDGMDSVCKEQSLELISYLSRNKKVFIVDHSSETKEIFSDIVTVQRNGLTSTVVNVS